MYEPYELFIEKAEKLELSSFWKWLRDNRFNANMDNIIAGDWLSYKDFNRDSLDAFSLNLRLLINDQDGISIRSIGEMSQQWPRKYDDLKENIAIERAKLKAYLEDKALVQIFENKETTNYDVFDVVMYGGIAHCNPKSRVLFKHVTEAGVFSYFLFSNFSDVNVNYRNCIVNVSYHVMQYLKHEGQYNR
jgi:hypothetical protein